MAETLASYQVPEHHVTMYTANVQAAIVKKGGLIYPLVSQGSYSGEKSQVVNFIGPVEFTERTTKYGDTKVSELEHTQRWITGTEYDCAIFVDRLDTLKMIYEPTSPYVERMREAATRKMDEIVVSKFFADAKVGKDGAETKSYSSTNTVVHGSASLTVAKLRSMRKLIKKKQIDLRGVKPYIAVTADEADNLLGETQVNSSDYNAVKVLVDGEVSQFMGFVFVPYEDSDSIGGTGKSIATHTDGIDTIRECPVWLSDGMNFGNWSGLEIRISDRPDKNHIKQIHGTFTAGATRIEERKVFQIECKVPA